MRKRTIVSVLAVAGTLVSTAVATQTGAAAATSSAVPNTSPSWVHSAQRLGAATPSASVTARVYLAPRGGMAALKQAATAVSTPGSASYRHFLSAAQYAAKYEPTAATAHSVAEYLRSQGLTVTSVGAARRYLSVAGTVAQAEKAFGTHLGRYKHANRTVRAPESAVTLPSSVASSVLTVVGLDTTPHLATPNSASDSASTATASPATVPPPVFLNARPCSTYFGQVPATYQADFKSKLPKFKGQTLSYSPCGYTGPQFRAAYEGNTSLTGKGITVAITDAYAAPSILVDANKYAENHGDGSYLPGQFSQNKPAKYSGVTACGPSGWYGEETLDVEAVHAMAPDANIRYYASASCFDKDFLDALGRVVDEDRVQLVSNSWSDLESNEGPDGVAAYEQVFLQGALEGISFMFSSGDDGDELNATGIKQVGYPSSDPYVTGVGGTSTGIGANGRIAFEAGWGTQKYSLSSDQKSWNSLGYLYGAGGGESGLFNRPSYQDGTVSGPYRAVPDVAMDADPTTGMLIGETQSYPDGHVGYAEYRIGGTSLASPLFAGLTALTLQSSGGGIGLLNPLIYSTQSAFTDVTGSGAPLGAVRTDFANGLDASGGLLYSIRTFNQNGSINVTPGYDETTGVGVPNTSWLTAAGAPAATK